jgi:hypothetical protein
VEILRFGGVTSLEWLPTLSLKILAQSAERQTKKCRFSALSSENRHLGCCEGDG